MGKLKVLDLFSGIGMFSYGLEKTGLYETVAFCELDNKCRQVLSKHWPDVHCFGDISRLMNIEGGILHDDIEGDTLFTDVDVICGGFPCQDISDANRNAEGISGSRSGLWLEYARLIGEIKPKGVLIENVSALRRKGLGTVLQDLHSLGYDAEWHCIPASALGAPHRRDRIWIVAYRIKQGIQGLQSLQYPSTSGQGGWGGKEDLQQVYNNPYGRSDKWPEPLVRRMDVPYPGRMDRLKQVSNTVYWPIVEQLGYHLHKNIMD